jgi:hypothetical protein
MKWIALIGVLMIVLGMVAVADDPLPSCILTCHVEAEWDAGQGMWKVTPTWNDSKRHNLIATLQIYIYDISLKKLEYTKLFPTTSGLIHWHPNVQGGKFLFATLVVVCAEMNTAEDWDLAIKP